MCREFEALARREGLSVLAWREVPVEAGLPGAAAREVMPSFRQVVVAGDHGQSGLELERLAFVLRKRAEHEIDGIYFPSLSARTLVYKGMLTAPQLPEFFHDLSDPLFESGLVLAHARFSTNTFPSWPLAHPYRYVAHNGEFNTVQGNRNWMRTREAMLASRLIPGDISRIFPVVTPGGSDSMSFDEVLELLHLGGRALPHALLMMIPEAWENKEDLTAERRAFYQFHSCVMEPWDGPAAVAFTDGTLIGAQLDRNGFRPLRYWVTDDDVVILASEVGVLDVPAAKIVLRGRIQPGRMFLVDTAAGRIVDDDEIKDSLAAELPYGAWLAAGLIDLEDLPMRRALTPQYSRLVSFQRQFGYTEEEIRLVLEPMVKTGCGAPFFHGRRHAAGRTVSPAPPSLRLFPPAFRPGDQPAARRHQRRAHNVVVVFGRPRRQSAGARPAVVPPDHAARAGAHQRRAGHSALRGRGRGRPRLAQLCRRRSFRGQRTGHAPENVCVRPSTRSAPR